MNRSPTMTDIAREAGVSKNTVSLALRGDKQIPKRTSDRIEEIAARMGYRKNPTVARLMAELRASRTPAFRSTIALVNANHDARAFTHHRTIPMYVRGCRERASELGYALDEFWMHEPDFHGHRLNRILRARGIQGVVVVGLMRENRLPSKFQATWEEFPCVVTGVRTRDPALSFACVDHHMLSLKAFEQAIALGYRRPALVLDGVIDQLVNNRFSAGVLVAQQKLPRSRRTRAFHDIEEARKDYRVFQNWLDREQPDVLLTLYHEVQRWLTHCKRSVPRDIGLIQLEWRPDHAQWAGMNQHNEITGAAAIEMLVGMIHANERGIPASPRGTLIGSTWIPGKTIREP